MRELFRGLRRGLELGGRRRAMILHALFWWVADVVKTFLAFACIVIGGVFLLFSGIVLLILGSPTGFTEKERRE